MSADHPSLTELNALDRDGFVRMLGGVFEHSPWVAEESWPARPFATVAELHARMVAVVRDAGTERQLALARAHPELAGAVMRGKLLTVQSTAEQEGAGLNALTDGEVRRFDRLNRRYRERFGFPFIMAVKEHTKDGILAAFQARLDGTPEEELRATLEEIAKIARFRLDALLAA